MTLNFTSYAPFPASIRSDDDFWSMGWLNWEINDLYENGGGRDWIDPIDLLPADPFGMELSSNLAVAIAGWFEDLGASSSDCKLYCWNGDYESGSSVWCDDELFGFQDDAFGSGVEDEDISETLDSKGLAECHPHEGLILSLGYLGVEDLLSIERVCRSLRSAVQNDPLLWRCIHIDDSPLSDKITDDALLRLTLRGQGSLQCLSLVGCSKITDDGLRMVLERNPMLQKLSVAECVRLSTDGLINNLKAFKSSGLTGIKNLKLGRLFSVSPEHYEELRLLLGGEKMKQPKSSKARFYHRSVSHIACDDDRAIDIEMCQRCEKFKLVFDCPSESCRRKGPENCRACDICIERCVQCGRCLNDCRFEETFCLRYLCSNCWKQAPPS